MSDEKIIQRVKNLLAMAEDAASPNEAAIAARRARALMDKHQIEKEDITSETSSAFGETCASKAPRAYEWMKMLAASAANINDCQAIISRTGKGVSFEFRGFASDANIAAEMMNYFKAACEKALSETTIKGLGPKNSFRYHFANSVLRRSVEIAKTRKNGSDKGKQLIIMKKQLVEQHFNDNLKKARRGKSSTPKDASTLLAAIKGSLAGEATSIHDKLDDEEAA